MRNSKVKPDPILVEVKGILERQHRIQKPYPPLDELIDEFEKDEGSTRRKVRWYKWSGMTFLVFIPIMSAIISAELLARYAPAWLIPALSLSLTIVTILNAAFRPDQRFTYLCNIGIGITNAKMGFASEVVNVTSTEKLDECISRWHQELQKFARQLVYTFLPHMTYGGKAAH